MIIVISVSMIYMKYSNITFNTISLAGIITVLGMIVDNSIVVSENIFNYHQKGFKGLDATKSAVGEVFMPMLVSTLTTVAAFTPMIFVSGTMGRLINQYPKVVIVALITSIFQAILLLPNNLITKDNLKTLTGMDAIIYKVHKKKNPLDFDKDKLFNILKIPFKKLLTFTLKIRYLIIILFIAILIFSIMISKSIFSKFTLVYDTSADVIVININTGIGSSIYKTKEYLSKIENIIYETIDNKDLIAVYSLAGKQLDKNSVEISEELNNLAGTMIYLVPANNREKTAFDIIDDLNLAIDKSKIKEELELLNKLLPELNNSNPIFSLNLTDTEKEIIKPLFLLTSKSMMIGANLSENELSNPEKNKNYVVLQNYSKEKNIELIPFSAKIEADLQDLDEEERLSYLEDLGVKESGVSRLSKAGHKLLKLITFLTSGEDETRAWTVREGAFAPEAAGVIHSDFERGFISAEVINCDKLLELGSFVKAKEVGAIRLEGKQYIMQEGDVVTFRFNV